MRTVMKLQYIYVCIFIAFFSIAGISTPASAQDNKYTTVIEQSKFQVEPGRDINIKFTVNSKNTLYLGIYLNKEQEFTYDLYYENNTNPLVSSVAEVGSPRWRETAHETPYYLTGYSSMTPGEYTLTLEFNADAEIIVYGLQQNNEQEINLSHSFIHVTKGFTNTISLNNYDGKVQYASQDTDIATVSEDGTITGISSGKTKIKVTTEKNKSYSCKVTVSENQYRNKQLSTEDIEYGESVLNTYNIAYDNNQNLIIHCEYINCSGEKTKALTNIAISVHTKEGRTIGMYTAKKLSKLDVPDATKKDFTFSIPRKKLSISEMQNLSIATVNTSGSVVYY